MLSVKVETENQQTHTRVSERALGDLVHRIGGRGDNFLVVQRIPDIPGTFVQVWHETGAGYTVEHRTGPAVSHVRTEVDDPERVVALMTRWAREEPGWDAGTVWESAGIPEPEPAPELPRRSGSSWRPGSGSCCAAVTGACGRSPRRPRTTW